MADLPLGPHMRADVRPPRWHADGCYVCNHCGSRRAPWQGDDAPQHHNRDCAWAATLPARPGKE